MKNLSDLLTPSRPEEQAAGADDLTKKAASFISEKWRQLRAAYYVYHLRIWETRLFYAGESWIDRDLAMGFWRPYQPKDEFVPMPMINEFAPAIDAIASNFNSIPEVEAIAVPSDSEDSMVVAEIANKLIDHCIKDNSLRSDYKSDEDKAGYSSQEFVLCGSTFTLVYPEDKQIGTEPAMQSAPGYGFHCLNCDVFQQPMAETQFLSCPQCNNSDPLTFKPVSGIRQIPELDEQGQPKTLPVTRKRIVVRHGDPAHAFPRPAARNMGETPYLLWGERFSLDEIRTRWNYEAKTDSQHPDAFALTYQHALSYWYMGYSQSTIDASDGALVVQCYIEPGRMKDWPDGLYGVWCNEQCIHAEPWPFVEHPATKGDYLQMPGIFFGRSVAFDLVQLQRELNRYESLIALHAMTNAVDSLVIDDNVVVSEVTGRCDKVIHGRTLSNTPLSSSIFRLQHGTLDQGVYDKRQQILEAFQRISAAVAVFRGEQPGSVTAASAIAQLRGQAELQFNKPTQNWNNLWKETIRKVIKNYQKFVPVGDLAAIVGPEKVEQLALFVKADLDTCLDYSATAHGLPRTRDERRQEMLLLFDKGAIDVNEPTVRQKLFELFGETGMMKSFNDDARRARANIRKITEGVPAQFRPGIDDAPVHLGIALEKAKALDFETLDPVIQQAIIGYIDQIQQFMASLAPPPVPPGNEPEQGGKPPQKGAINGN